VRDIELPAYQRRFGIEGTNEMNSLLSSVMAAYLLSDLGAFYRDREMPNWFTDIGLSGEVARSVWTLAYHKYWFAAMGARLDWLPKLVRDSHGSRSRQLIAVSLNEIIKCVSGIEIVLPRTHSLLHTERDFGT